MGQQLYKTKNYLERRDKILARNRAWWHRNREKMREYDKERAKTNHRRFSKNASKRKRFGELREEIFNILGHACIRCGFSDKRALQFDHVNANGSKHRKQNGGIGIYRDILNNPDKFQVLCANCNWIKRFECGENPKRIPWANN